MKGIILAGGSGTRLYPITQGISKQLLPIYDKPMIYYPLSVLMLAGIQDILIITTSEDNNSFKRLLKDGNQWGIKIQYAIQEKPEGIAQAFLIGEKFLDGETACLILGDNIFHGAGLTNMLLDAKFNAIDENATVFGYRVNDPERYGVAEIDEMGYCIDIEFAYKDGAKWMREELLKDLCHTIEEKPKNPKSNYAVTGLYFYPSDVVEKAKQIKPSDRGELEITTLNQMYIKEDRLNMEILPRGAAWLDTGTFESLSNASNYIETIEKRQGMQIACLEEIAYNQDWVSKNDVEAAAKLMEKNDYGKYLQSLIKK